MPAPKIECAVTIHRVDGDPLRFKLRRTIDEMRNAGATIENGLSANYLGVVLEGKLIVVPSHRISGIEIDPAQNVLIAHVIKDVEPV